MQRSSPEGYGGGSAQWRDVRVPRGNLLKLVWHDGIGLCMLTKRLERGHFIWPTTSTARSHCRQDNCQRCSKGANGGRRRAICGPNWQVDAKLSVITLESLAA